MTKYINEYKGIKVGDFVTVIVDTSFRGYKKGYTFKVDRIYSNALKIFFPKIGSGVEYDEIKRSVVDNELNRKLYPSYIKFGDYLIPKDCNE